MAFACPAQAQSGYLPPGRFENLPEKAHLDYGMWWAPRWVTTALALGDLDGDGDLDLVEGQYENIFTLMQNDGSARFRNLRMRGPADIVAGWSPIHAMALGDVDGDGDLDVVYTNSGRTGLFRNHGGWSFPSVTPSHMPTHTGLTRALALGDIDRDGDLDLVLGLGEEEARQNRLYLNDGAGRFVDATTARLPMERTFTSSVALGDLDGDGDLDIVFGNGGGAGSAQGNNIYLNDGAGAFTDASPRLLPAGSFPTEAIVLGDLDGDGDLDLVEGNVGQNRLYWNDGTGRFVDGTNLRMPRDNAATYGLDLGDLDGDGDLDLILGNRGENLWYENDGFGVFSTAGVPQLPQDRDETRVVALGDLDKDGDLDLVCGNEGHNRVYLNDGTGSFTSATSSRLPSVAVGATDLAFSDVDGDGDLDLVVAAGEPPELQTRLFLNQGLGRFAEATATGMPVDGDVTRAIVCGDVDGDGDPDLVLGNGGTPPRQNRLYFNDGSGRFRDVTATHLPADADRTNDVVLGDVDGDGDLDLVLGNGGTRHLGQQDRLYVNDGTGRFTDATLRMPVDRAVTRALAAADVDRDGDLDLVFGGSGPNRLYVNDGTGSFSDATATSLPADEGGNTSLALVDMDGDRVPDLVLGNPIPYRSKLLRNDGKGRFQGPDQIPRWTSDGVGTLATGDVDGEGTTDLVLAAGDYSSGRSLATYTNDGSGELGTDTGFRRFGLFASAIVLGDIDADGDLDAAVASSSTQGSSDSVQLYVNLSAQASTPHLAAVGHPYRLVIHAVPDRFAYDGPYRVYPALSLALAPSPAHIPSVGTLFLEPTRTTLLPLRYLHSSFFGPVSVEITIPAVPALVGRTVYAQALIESIGDPYGDRRLTNYTADVLVK